MFEKFPALAAFKKSRWYKPSLWLGGLYLAYVLFGFFVLPPIIKAQLLKQLPPITKRQVTIRQVRFNPLMLSLTIRGFSLNEPDGQVFASWEELYVNFQLSSIFRLGWTFDEISLKQPYGHLIWFKDGQFNFSNMGSSSPPAAKPSQPEPKSAFPVLIVRSLHIDDGRVVWEDRTHSLPIKTELAPLNFSLTNLTTRIGKESAYGFEAKLDSGKRLAWAGELVTQPFALRGHLELEGIEGAKWTAYLRDYIRAVVTKGRVNVAADYAMASGTNGFSLVVSNGAVGLYGFEVMGPTNNEVITTLSRLEIKPITFDLLGHSLRAGVVKLDGYTKAIRLEKDGSLNLNLIVEQRDVVTVATNIAAASAPPPAKAASVPWVFAVDDFQLTNATVTFADLSRASRFETTISPMSVRVRGFTTKPETDATFEFRIPSEAGEVASGKGTLCVTPLRLGGVFNASALEVKKYLPYYEAVLNGEVRSGKLNVATDFHLRSTAEATDLTLSNADVALSDFQLKGADSDETIVTIPSLAVEQTEFDLRKQSVTAGLVKSADATILGRRDKEGAINLAKLWKVAPKAGESTETNAPVPVVATNESKAASAPWVVLIKEVGFTNYSVKWEDQKLAKPASLSLDQLGFDLKNISTISNETMQVSLSARLNQAGVLQVGGSAKISPLTADLDVDLGDLELRPFQPYVTEGVRLGISRGKFSLRSHVRYGGNGEGGPKLKFTGDLALTNLLTADEVFFKEFVRWDLLSVSGIDFELEPNRLRIGEVRWRGLNTSLVIGPDHRSNLQIILPEKATNAPAAAASAKNAAPAAPTAPAEFPIQIDALTLENTALHFADGSIEPNCAFDIADFGGSIKGLSSDPAATATVDLRGKVDAAAPFAISGKVNPLAKDLRLDLVVGFTNTDLTAFSTYMEKYGGYPLTKGKLSMDLRYDIHQKQLKAQNNFVIDHFTLGAHNDSTNATHLPIKLAVALLKDSAGRIDLDIPLSGRTDDPQFSIVPILLKTLVNLMLKAATSPFSLLGSLVGGGEELSFVEFAPGKAEVSDAEAQKLGKLETALEQRPALNLEIAGAFDAQADRDALAKAKLEQKIRVLRAGEIAQSGGSVSSIDSIQVEPGQRERLLRLVQGELGTNQTLVLPPVARTDTNSLEVVSNTAGTVAQAPQPAVPAAHRLTGASAAQTKGASLLMSGIELTGAGVVKAAPVPKASAATTDAPAAGVDLEARLLAAIQVSDDEKRDLMKRRALAVQTEVLKSGKIAADRLFIVIPKSAASVGKDASRANLTLE